MKKFANINFIMVESIMVLDNPYVKFKADEQYLRIASIIRNLSALKGTKYFSPSHKKYRLLFREFYRIPNLESNEKINDPTFNSYKDAQTIYIFQEDLTFGKNKQELSFRFIDSKEYPALFTRMQLKTSMKKFFLTIIDRDELVSLNFIYCYGRIFKDSH